MKKDILGTRKIIPDNWDAKKVKKEILSFIQKGKQEKINYYIVDFDDDEIIFEGEKIPFFSACNHYTVVRILKMSDEIGDIIKSVQGKLEAILKCEYDIEIITQKMRLGDSRILAVLLATKK